MWKEAKKKPQGENKKVLAARTGKILIGLKKKVNMGEKEAKGGRNSGSRLRGAIPAPGCAKCKPMGLEIKTGKP